MNPERRSVRAALPGIALAVVWALEIFAVQELSLVAPHSQAGWSPWINRGVRLLLDLSACGLVVVSLPRLPLALLFALNPLFYLTVLGYREHFEQSLSVLVIRHHAGEGLAVIPAALALLEPWHLVFALLLGVKLWLLRRRPSPARAPTVRAAPIPRLRVGGALAALYVLVLLASNATLKPMWKIAEWESVGGTGSIYGYLPTWTAETVYLDGPAMLARAIERADDGSDALTPVEVAAPLRERLVFLQVESLDLALLGFRIDGRPIVPRLERIVERSMAYAVRARKGTGSSDSDFLALTGMLPSPDVATYKLLDYPYRKTFVEKLEARGYRTSAVHGVSGEFFNRRFAFRRMGFDRIVFKEELVEGGLEARGWAVDDRDVLEFAARQLAEASGRQFQIVITADTHLPFHGFDAHAATFFPGSDVPEENYFDAFHEVDAAVGRYLDALPRGTTLVIYGDHASGVENGALGYPPSGGGDCVPFLIHNVGEDLRGLQRVDGGLRRTGAGGRRAGRTSPACDLTLQDALRYVHHHALERSGEDGDLTRGEGRVPGRMEGVAVRAEPAGQSPRRPSSSEFRR